MPHAGSFRRSLSEIRISFMDSRLHKRSAIGVPNTPADFWRRVRKTRTCWLWTGAIQRRGNYGKIHYQGQVWFTHRLAYTLTYGTIPRGRCLDHLCQNGRCVRPSHLEPVTDRQNRQREVQRRTHFRCGHPITTSNTYWQNSHSTTRQRRCRACVRSQALRLWRLRHPLAPRKRRADAVAEDYLNSR